MPNKKKKEVDKKSKNTTGDLHLDNEKIVEILLKESYIKEEDVKQLHKDINVVKSNLIAYLLSKGIVTQDLIGQAISEYLKIPYADLNSLTPPKKQILKIPKKIAIKYRAILFNLDKNEATISSDNVLQNKDKEVFKKILGVKKINFAYSLSQDVDQLLLNYKESLKDRLAKIIESEENVAPDLIQEIFSEALALKASDVHFEPQKEKCIIRLRVDGALQLVAQIPFSYYENILNYIKVKANMSIDEHFSTQDGSIRMFVGNSEVDMRISIVPIIGGEKIVIRLLAQYVKDYFLNDLGLSEKNKEILIKSSKKPFGMILVTGPTGSGKTTTLYSLLKTLHKPDVNITTIEDPVEYRLLGVNQIQVNKKTDLSFAKGLRSVVRQDPDIILVGEIRDEETAEISVNAALTGHLLLSTFHANDAATTIPRLLDMGIEPFLLSSTLELIIAQRLARKICDHCRYSYNLSKTELSKNFPELSKYFKKSKTNIYKSKGCPTCNYTGYNGRIAIFELIQVSGKIKEMVLDNPSSEEIKTAALKNGFRSLFEDGVEKVKNGQTTLEELLRVAQVD